MIARLFKRARSTPVISSTDRLAASPHVSYATQHGRAMLLDRAGGDYYSLNESGDLIWEMVRRGTTLGEIVDALEARYDAPRERIAADASTMVGELVSADMVTICRTGR